MKWYFVDYGNGDPDQFPDSSVEWCAPFNDVDFILALDVGEIHEDEDGVIWRRTE
jgi:hypothetical protein